MSYSRHVLVVPVVLILECCWWPTCSGHIGTCTSLAIVEYFTLLAVWSTGPDKCRCKQGRAEKKEGLPSNLSSDSVRNKTLPGEPRHDHDRHRRISHLEPCRNSVCTLALRTLTQPHCAERALPPFPKPANQHPTARLVRPTAHPPSVGRAGVF